MSALLICVGVFIATVAVAWFRPWKLLPPSTGSLPAVPARSVLMGCGSELGRAFANGSVELLLFRWLRDFGGNRFVAIPAPGLLMIFVNDPDVSRAVNNDRDFHATTGTVDTFETYAKGLVALEGSVWAVHRRAVTRAFYPDNLRLVCTAADSVISGWLAGVVSSAASPSRVQWDASHTFLALYLDVMGRAMLSTDFGGLVRAREATGDAQDPIARPVTVLESFSVVFKTLSKLSGIPKPLWGILMPAREMDHYRAAKGLIRSLATRLTDERVAARKQRQPERAAVGAEDTGATRDFLDIMLDETDSATLSMSEVVDEVMIMLVGATETTAVTTGWLLYALARDAAGAPTPEIYEGLFEFDPVSLVTRTPVDAQGRIAETDASLSIPAAAAAPWRRTLDEVVAAKAAGSDRGDLWARLTEEVTTVVGSIDPGATLRYEHLDKLVLCDGVIKETLRLYNTASATARHATKDFVAAGHAIPKGTQVVTANLAMHTDPENYPRPLEFLPERWASSAPASIRPTRPATQIFNGFGNGHRNCVGQRFAQILLKVFIVRLVQTFEDVALAPHCPPIVPICKVTTQVREGPIMEALLRSRA